MQKQLLTLEDTARLFGVTYARAAELARERIIPVVPLGRQIRVDPETLTSLISGGDKALPGGFAYWTWRLFCVSNSRCSEVKNRLDLSNVDLEHPPNRFLLGRRTWIPRWRSHPCENLAALRQLWDAATARGAKS